MQNLDVKTLKKIATIIIALMAICIFLVFMRSPKKEKVPERVVLDALNNNEKIVHHGDNIYCYAKVADNASGKMEYLLIKLPMEFDNTTDRGLITNLGTASENLVMNVYDNKIFYIKNGTHFYDIDKNKIKKFCDGELQFMIEPNQFVQLKNGDLYKGTYYKNNYVVSEQKQIADGNFIKVDEDNTNVYYYSTTGNHNTIVIALNKTNLKIYVLDTIETIKDKVKDIVVTDNYLYVAYGNDEKVNIKKISKAVDKYGNTSKEILEIPKLNQIRFIDTKYTKPQDKKLFDRNFDDVYFYGSTIEQRGGIYIEDVLNTTLYKYETELDLVSETSCETLNDLFTENYSIAVVGDKFVLRHMQAELTQIPTKISSFENVELLEVVNIEIIENYLYYEVRIKADGKSDVVLARIPLEGGESARINIAK